ncbi:MAG: UDP-N-acetylglucosamine 2-epimerase, partial [Candidatus Staskawiczbacteria bacterium]|nr:UDP-N-acetylglucosamine 2-epimerase [Candidatus Staskawiczbacteria bacterium]
GFSNFLKGKNNFILIKPMGYLDMINLMENAKLVLTDSGGIQEETTVLKIPCLTLRNSTERPITVEIGTNKVIGTNRDVIIKEIFKIFKNGIKDKKIPKYWDGKTAERIIKIINNKI